MTGFRINKLNGLLKVLAESIDKGPSGNDNKFIDDSERSIFLEAANILKDEGKISAREYNSIFDRKINLNEQYVCVADNTRVVKNLPLHIIPAQNTPTGYDYKSDSQYPRVCDFITKQFKSHGVKNPTQEQIDNVAKMVLEKCKKYNVSDLAPIIAQILETESGGYVFNDKVLVHSGSHFKGSMQVNLEAICCMYGEQELREVPLGGKNKKTGRPKTVSCKKPKAVYEGDYNNHYKQDAAKIAALKAEYPTPMDLYTAIQSDPELGLEVCIIVFKSKISVSRGSIKDAIGSYCGSQYSCNQTGCPSKIDVGKRC